MQTASIVNVLGQYPGLKWSDLVSPDYPTPEHLEVFVRSANGLIMGTGGAPTIPLFIGQGANGELEGTPGNKAGIGAGDGVMIAGDVRTLARDYSREVSPSTTRSTPPSATSGASPSAAQLDHVDQAALRRPGGPAEIKSICEGNPLTPIPVPPAPGSPV